MSKKEITIIVSIMLSIYLGMAFIAMEFNPAKWHLMGRVCYILATLIALAVTFLDDEFNFRRFKDM